MHFRFCLLAAALAVVPAFAADPSVPSLKVPACPAKGTVKYDLSVPNRTAFPLTQVDLCYDYAFIHLNFTAYNETNFFYNSSYTTNDPIYNYEVMEAFIYYGKNDPSTYLEFEVAPNNVTFNAFIYNPSKVRAAGAPFDRFYITDPQTDSLLANTTLDMPAETWVSTVQVPLGFFNVDNGTANGTNWRMNFFRTIVSPETYPNQTLGGWSPPDAANFHETPYFGHVHFV